MFEKDEFYMSEDGVDFEDAFFYCPECGDILSYGLVKGKNGTVNLSLFCEGAGDDLFVLEIMTGLTSRDLDKLEKGKPSNKEVTLKVWERRSEKKLE